MKKWITAVLSAATIACAATAFACLPTHTADAADDSKEAIAVNSVNYDPSWQVCSINFNKAYSSNELGNWDTPPDTTKFHYTDSEGNDVSVIDPKTFKDYIYVLVNAGGSTRGVQVGDIVTLDEGLVLGNYEIKETVSYQYKTENAPWVKYPEVEVERTPTEVDMNGANKNISLNDGFGANGILVKFTGDGGLGTYEQADKDSIEYVNAYGEKQTVPECTHTGQNHFIIRMTNALMVGDKITFKAGMTIGTQEVKADETFIIENTAAGSVLVPYDPATHDVTSLEITNNPEDNLVVINGALKLNYTVNQGAIATPKFTTSDAAVATVNASGGVTGIGEGEATITATVGAVSDTYKVRVIDAQVEGAELVTFYKLYAVKGEALATPADWTARLLYTGNLEGTTVALTADTLSFDKVDTSAAGTGKLTAHFTLGGNEYTQEVEYEVVELFEMSITEVAIVEWFGFNSFVEFPNSTLNSVNITTEAAGLANLSDKISYVRADGTAVSTGVWVLGDGNIAILPSWVNPDNIAIDLDNFMKAPFYQEGDIITLEKGLTAYRFTGDKAAGTGNLVPGTGMIIAEAMLAETVQYKFDGQGWSLYVEYTDVASKNENISVVIGKPTDVGAVRVPANATEGTFTFTSSDESIATVTNKGVITGKKAGTVTITVTLSGGTAGEKTTTITVNVTDAITKVEFEEGTVLKVKKGTEELDLSGLKANFVWASGKTEEADMATATVIGYDPDEVGETQVTVKFTKDGQTYSTTLTINVVKGGCGSSVSAFVPMGIGVALIAAVLVVVKKKSQNK